MNTTGDLRVSSRGQMSLPSSTRHRWGLEEGGDVSYLDLGSAILIVPGGAGALKRKVLDTLTREDWELAQSGFGDPELANQ